MSLEIVKEADIAPMHIGAGDSLYINYRDNTGYEHNLLAHKFDESLVVDRVVIAKLDADEAAKLGMSEGFGAFIGKKSSG